MSMAAYLGIVMVVGVIVLLFMVIKLKVQAFISLLIVSMGVGIFSGMPLDKVITSMTNGMGGTLGFIAVVVGLGSMFGKMLEVSGGTQRLARTLINKFGKEKASYALALTGFIVAIPVFFDVGFILIVPIVYSLARETKKSVLHYGIPLLAGLAVTHAFVPPTPGPVAVAQLVNADLGKVILFGIIAGIPATILAGPVFGKYIGKKINVGVPDYMMEGIEKEIDEKDLPSFSTIFSLILIPLVLIVLNTISSTFLDPNTFFAKLLKFIGHPFTALTVATILSFIVLGRFRGLSKEDINKVSTSALNSSGLIILITGAGGVFKQILIDSGVGDVLAQSVSSLNLSPILLAFIIALIVRVAAGSATVAMMTAGGIVAPMLSNFSVEPALIVIAIASGSTALSHVNDSGFWLVNRYFGINEKDTLRSWTVMETIIGLVGLSVALILDIFI